jgi:hypothetical protein
VKTLASVALLILLEAPSAGVQVVYGQDGSTAREGGGDEGTVPPPSIGVLLQLDGIAESQVVEKGFIVRASRVMLSGEIHGRFSYFVQVNLITEPALLDTRLRVRFSEQLGVEAGQVKSPFSREFLKFRGDQLMTELPSSVIALAPKRQIGTTVEYTRGSARLKGGIYNGNGRFDLMNDGPGMMIVARVEQSWKSRAPSDRGAIYLGLSAAFSSDDNAFIPGVYDAFAGERVLLGADAEIEIDRLVAAAEVVAGWFDEEGSGSPSNKPWGVALTSGYAVRPSHQILGRADYFDRDRSGDGTWLIAAGYSFRPVPHVRFGAEYRFDATRSTTAGLVGRFQVGFK